MKTILIADDEPHVARVLRLVLENEGYQVHCVENGKEALDKYARLQPDVLIADIQMPILSGKELVSKVRDLPGGVDVPVIVMTSSLESRHKEWLSNMPSTRFVGKPVSPRELVTIINGFFPDSQPDAVSAAS